MFLSVDPLAADFVAWCPYNYVLGNPLRFVDPDGKAPQQSRDPKKLARTIKFGSKSMLFTNLLDLNGSMTTKTYISYGDCSFLNRKTSEITIRNNQLLGDEVLALTHELTNSMYQPDIRKAQLEAAKGEISPEQYADKIISIESISITNIIVVAVELGVKYGKNPGTNKLIELYASGKISRGRILEIILASLKLCERQMVENLPKQNTLVELKS